MRDLYLNPDVQTRPSFVFINSKFTSKVLGIIPRQIYLGPSFGVLAVTIFFFIILELGLTSCGGSNKSYIQIIAASSLVFSSIHIIDILK